MKSELVTFKGTKNGLLINIDDKAAFILAKEKLVEKFESASSFFSGANVTVDLGERVISKSEEEDIKNIINKKYGMNLSKIIKHSNTKIKEEIKDKNFKEKKDKVNTNIFNSANENELKNSLKLADTKIIKKTIRSGQKLYCQGNAVILGDINPGGEVVATNDIIIFGVLRGIAHAGAKGNKNSIVAAYRLQPTQLRIASKLSRAPDNETIKPKEPEVAVIGKNGNIYIDTYSNYLENFKEGK